MANLFRLLVLLLAALLVAPAFAQAQKAPTGQAPGQERVDRAKERCLANRGVDCESPEGLKEWVLQERTREEAVREGSRHLLPGRPQTPARR